jgi:GABA(A) receptor-associated protein
MEYKKRETLEVRKAEAAKVFEKYPGRIPIIVERAANAKTIPLIDKNKFLVPADLTLSQFIFVIRTRLTLPPEQALFLFVGNTLSTTSTLMKELYSTYREEDGFLYVKYCGENTFGK